MAGGRRARRNDNDAAAVARALDGTPAADARGDGSTPRAEALRSLQRRIGNRAVGRMLLDPPVGGAAATQSSGAGTPGYGTTGVIARSLKVAQVAPDMTTAGRTPRGGRDTEARRKIGIEKVAPNATALGELGDDYGVTWPQTLRFTLGAKLDGDNWVPTITDIVGEYSVQARILPHQTDIASEALATALNYQEMIDALDALGTPGDDHDWYSLKAVQKHESRHATRALQALMDVREAITARMEQVTVARANKQETPVQAVARIQGTAPAYGNAVAASFALWDAKFDELIDGDHAGHGPCDEAEQSVTVPLKAAILARATAQRWIAPPAQVALH